MRNNGYTDAIIFNRFLSIYQNVSVFDPCNWNSWSCGIFFRNTPKYYKNSLLLCTEKQAVLIPNPRPGIYIYTYLVNYMNYNPGSETIVWGSNYRNLQDDDSMTRLTTLRLRISYSLRANCSFREAKQSFQQVSHRE